MDKKKNQQPKMPPVYFLYSTLKKHFKSAASSSSGKATVAPVLPDYPGNSHGFGMPLSGHSISGMSSNVTGMSGTMPLVKNKPKNPLPPLYVTTSCGSHGLDTIPEVTFLLSRGKDGIFSIFLTDCSLEYYLLL